MGQAILVFVAYLGVGILQLVLLFRQKEKKKIAAYLVFWTVALVFSVLLVLNVKLPSFERFIIDKIQSMGGGG